MTHGPRDAIGATVYVTANGFRQRADVISGGSYASTSDPRLHFGLGPAEKVDSVEVHWPGGAVDQVKLPGVDAILYGGEGERGGEGAVGGREKANPVPKAAFGCYM